MSRLAHVMCDECFYASDFSDDEWLLTKAHADRICCWCRRPVEYSLIVHRHPDAVKCEGKHEVVL